MKGQPRRYSNAIDEFDRAAEEQTEARVVNVSPHIARFSIAGSPGSPPRRVKLQPGEGAHIAIGYTKEFLGAGRQPVRATVESLTEREAYPKGPRLPMVVHEERASEVSARWRQALEDSQQKADLVEVAIPTADGAEPIKAMIAPQSNAPNPALVAELTRQLPVIDEEDQGGGPLDEPPPDHNEPIELPKAPKAKGK